MGDQIRIVRMPSGIDGPGYVFHPDTRLLYERLIERCRSVRVNKIDEQGLPWIDGRFELADGTWEWHSLAVNEDSWVRVQHRSR